MEKSISIFFLLIRLWTRDIVIRRLWRQWPIRLRNWHWLRGLFIMMCWENGKNLWPDSLVMTRCYRWIQEQRPMKQRWNSVGNGLIWKRGYPMERPRLSFVTGIFMDVPLRSFRSLTIPNRMPDTDLSLPDSSRFLIMIFRLWRKHFRILMWPVFCWNRFRGKPVFLCRMKDIWKKPMNCVNPKMSCLLPMRYKRELHVPVDYWLVTMKEYIRIFWC